MKSIALYYIPVRIFIYFLFYNSIRDGYIMHNYTYIDWTNENKMLLVRYVSSFVSYIASIYQQNGHSFDNA